MTACDIILIVAVTLAFASAVGVILYKKIKGKGGCCSECSECSSCPNCSRLSARAKIETDEEKKNDNS